MSEVGAALCAVGLNALHAHGHVDLAGDLVFVDRLIEAGPAATSVVLGVADEQWLVADNAVVHAVVGGVPVLSGERTFGACLLGDYVLLWGQSFAKFGVVNLVLGHTPRLGASPKSWHVERPELRSC